MSWENILKIQKTDKYIQEYERIKELKTYFDENGTETFWNAYKKDLELKDHKEAMENAISTIHPSNSLDDGIFFDLVTTSDALGVIAGEKGNEFLEAEIEQAIDMIEQELGRMGSHRYRAQMEFDAETDPYERSKL